MAESSLFDALIGELMSSTDGDSLIDLCFSGDSKKISAVPLRYRLIALGFVQKLSLDQVNQKLTENGCMKLYARSLREASLMFAFRNGLSYKEWKELEEECDALRTEIKEGKGALSASSISCADIENYVDDNSLQDNEIAMTEHRTQLMARELVRIKNDKKAFRDFLLSNIHSFSTVREKTRYYFCKYLMYYLNTCMERYFQMLEKGSSRKKALELLAPFKVRTALDRKKYDEKTAREMIITGAISVGAVYDAFRDFYFESISLDWLQIRAEYTGDIDELEGEDKKRFAEAVRKYDRRYKTLSDDQLIEQVLEDMEAKEEEKDASYSRDNKAAMYQTGRAGGNFIRKVLRGEVDLDRTTFIAFLLFLGKEADVPEEQQIDKERLDRILQECGFPSLDVRSGCDRFFIDFIEADEPMYFIMDKAEEMALSEENFYLYKTYLKSESSEKKWEELTS